MYETELFLVFTITNDAGKNILVSHLSVNLLTLFPYDKFLEVGLLSQSSQTYQILLKHVPKMPTIKEFTLHH